MKEPDGQQIDLQVEGDLIGHQIAIGEHIVQIHAEHGSIVYAGETKPTITPRPKPVLKRPRPFPHLLDRTTEKQTITNALNQQLPVQLMGESGIGKTAVLRYLSHTITPLPDGLVYLRVHQRPLADIWQMLYDSFYESDLPVKQTASQLQSSLQDKQALIFLDDVTLNRDEIEELLNCLPQATFFLSGLERVLWQDGKAIALEGLPFTDADDLLARELGQAVTEDEALRIVHEKLKGHPFRLLQLASLMREKGVSLAQVAQKLGGTMAQITEEAIEVSTQVQQTVLGVLAALQVACRPVYLAKLANLNDIDSILSTLEGRGFAREEDGNLWQVAEDVQTAVQQRIPPDPIRLQAVQLLTSQAQSQRANLDPMIADIPLIESLAEWAIQHKRASEALLLIQSCEPIFIIAKQWEAWQILLQMAEKAADNNKQHAFAAWVFHEQGTRALLLGDKETARRKLKRALALRRQLGDTAGATITQHNLGWLPVAPPVRVWWHWAWIPFLLIVLGIIGSFVWSNSVGGETTVDTPTPAISQVIVEINTKTPTPAFGQAVVDTNTDTPTSTSTVTASATTTQTPSFTPTHTPSATPTPRATASATSIATNTPTPSLTSTPTATPICPNPPDGWVPYAIQRGDTLYGLSVATGTSIAQIEEVNCIADPRQLTIGSPVWLPTLPSSPTPTPTARVVVVASETAVAPPTPTGTPTLTPFPPPVAPSPIALGGPGEVNQTYESCSGSVNLIWSAVGENITYRPSLQRRDPADTTWQPFTLPSTQNTFSDISNLVTGNTQYRWYVDATDELGRTSPPSVIYYFTCLEG